jgi:hypothetical protein
VDEERRVDTQPELVIHRAVDRYSNLVRVRDGAEHHFTMQHKTSGNISNVVVSLEANRRV